MLGSSSYGSETLKNLVLPGVGHVTIIDDAKVTNRDFGNDFLVKREHLGQNKAKSLALMLAEMNPDSKVEGVDCSIIDAIQNKKDLLSTSQMIIACDVNQ
jgi:amyloid beta precursor protein binding protein 1